MELPRDLTTSFARASRDEEGELCMIAGGGSIIVGVEGGEPEGQGGLGGRLEGARKRDTVGDTVETRLEDIDPVKIQQVSINPIHL